MQNVDDETCAVLSRACGLLAIIKREIEGRDDGDDDAVLAIIGVLDADLEKAIKLAVNRRDMIEREAA